jgi:hypothetical protein
MKTRIIQTRFWDDEFVFNASKDAKLLYIYLLTSQYINICGIFQLDERKIAFEIAMTPKEFEKAKEELVRENKVCFYKGWVKVINAEKNNGYKNSPLNEVAYQRELSLIPQGVLDYFNSSIDTSIDSSMHTNHKSEIRNNKYKIINKTIKTEFENFEDLTPEVCQSIATEYEVTLQEVLDTRMDMEVWLGKTSKNKYKDYKLALMNWVRKNKQKKTETPTNNFRRGGYIDITE